MTRLDKNLAALCAMSPAQLRDNWCEISSDAAPAVPAPLLRRLLAQRLQEKRHGRLSLLVIRELERAASPSTVAISGLSHKKIELTPGTRLIREWNGRTIVVEVREDGFLWENRIYRSLSEIAREVTSAHWSGPRFFGLNRRG